ncbi:response regulator transcription factor [Streptomyces mirabilis]
MMVPARLAVIADDPLIREGVRAFMRASADVEVLDQEGDSADVTLMLTGAVTEIALSCMARLSAADPSGRLRLVLVADGINETQLARAVGHGLVSVLLRQQAPLQQVLRAVLVAYGGGADMPSRLLRSLIDQFRSAHSSSGSVIPHAGLTPREIEVLKLIAEGLSTANAAQRLHYSERTLKNILYRLSVRLGLRTRAQAVAYAIRTGAL